MKTERHLALQAVAGWSVTAVLASCDILHHALRAQRGVWPGSWFYWLTAAASAATVITAGLLAFRIARRHL